jgi:hypothetical protein
VVVHRYQKNTNNLSVSGLSKKCKDLYLYFFIFIIDIIVLKIIVTMYYINKIKCNNPKVYMLVFHNILLFLIEESETSIQL